MFDLFRRMLAWLVPLLMLGAVPAAAQDAPVTVTETRELFTLSNGIVTATVSKRTGDLVSMIYKDVETVEKDSGGHSGGYWSHDTSGGKETIARISIDPKTNGGARAEVSVKGISGGIKMGHGPGTAPDGDVALDIDIRYAIGRGERGIYTYSVLDHRPEYAAGFMAEARYAVKLEDFYTHMHVDDARSGKYPLLNEGIDKYVYTALQWEERVFGWTSPARKMGWFMMNPSAEFLSGGPTKAEFLAHGTSPTVLNYWKSSHYGGASVNFKHGEAWTKVIGPVFFYVNEGDSHEAMVADAKAQLAREEKKWPLGWVDAPSYAKPAERGTVSGRLQLDDPTLRNRFPGTLTVGLATAPYQADTILGRRTITWDTDGKHYQFWSRQTARDGRFEIGKVSPGSYTLYAYAEGVLGEFAKAEVVVPPGGKVDLGTLRWQPTREGRQLWDIGTADRSGAEFAHAERYFDPGVQLRYGEKFPNGTDYRIGSSTPGKDWFFVQAPDAKGQKAEISPFRGVLGTGAAMPYRIRFALPAAGKGTATLRVAITATGASALDVTVNGQAAGQLKLGRAEGAITRHQIHGKWYELKLPFDGRQLKKGENELVVTVPAGPLNAGVVYDYLRLELDERRTYAEPAPASTAPSLPATSPSAVRSPAVSPKTADWPFDPPRPLAGKWAGTDLRALARGEGELADWAMSRDGEQVALGLRGSDGFETVKVIGRGGDELPDRVRWVRNSRLQWAKDDGSFFYAGYGEPPTDPFLKEFGVSHVLYRHRLGTAQDQDEPVYFSDRARTMHRPWLSEDGNWLVVNSSLPDNGGESITLVDLASPHPAPWPLVATNTHRWRFAGNDAATFYFVTDDGAPRRRLMAFEVTGTSNQPRELVPEKGDTLVSAHVAGGRAALIYQRADGLFERTQIVK